MIKYINNQLLIIGVVWAEYSYISERVVQLLGNAKIRPSHEPYHAPPWKVPLIYAEKSFNECQQSAHKYYGLLGLGLGLGLWFGLGLVLGLLCQLGLVLRLGSV